MAGDVRSEGEKSEPMVGSYRLLQPLGSGGMSSVFRAAHAQSGLEVAVKILPRNLAKNPTLLQRFQREAASAEALEHPNIVAIYDRGVDQGRNYLVLEYVAGGDLHDWVRANGPMPVADAIKVVRSVAEGMRFAGERGLIHRDIKPANLLLTPSGQLKIADLGLALKAESEDERVTREGTTVGTVDYMAPEQARDSRATSFRSDIYSLGCTFFFLLTGQPPFAGGDIAEKLTRHCSAAPPDPGQFRSDVSKDLSKLIFKMLAKRPERRFSSYDDLILALDSLPSGPAEKAEREEAGPAALYAIVDEEEEVKLGPISGDLGERGLMVLGAAPAREQVDEAFPGGISMAELAELDGDEKRETVIPRRLVPAVIPPARAIHEVEPVELDLFEEEEEDVESGVGGAASRSGVSHPERGMSASERAWLMSCIAAGLSLVLVVIGADQLIRASGRPTTVELPVSLEGDSIEEPVEGELGKAVVVTAKRPVTNSTTPHVVVAPWRKEEIKAVALEWVEPVDPGVEVAAETAIEPKIESRIRPEWVVKESVGRFAGKVVIVRRVPDALDGLQKGSVRAALDAVGVGTLELADNGPFFEEGLRFTGDALEVRARPGFRPIVSVEGAKKEGGSKASAMIDLEGRTLLLEGLDLVVDVKEGASALFESRGGNLTLRNCTVTVLNRGESPFSVVRVSPGATGRNSSIRFERTMVRGELGSVLDLAGGAANVLIDQSVLVNGLGSAVLLSGPAAERAFFFDRSLVATRGAAFESLENLTQSKSRGISVRALGTSFVHLSTPARASLFLFRGEGGGASEQVSWMGDLNTFSGWGSWLAVGSEPSIRVSDLSAARTVWRGTDAGSREMAGNWTLSESAVQVSPESLRRLAPERADVLTRVASSSARLLEKTVEPFRTPAIPGLNMATGGVGVAGGRGPSIGGSSSVLRPKMLARSTMNLGDGDARKGVTRAGIGSAPVGVGQALPALVGATSSAGKTISGVRELWFATDAMPWMGDLGAFITQSIKPGDRLVRVRAWGSGEHVWTPTRLPEGVSLEVVVVPDKAGATPTWAPAAGVSGEGLITIRGGSLSVAGLHVTRDGSTGLSTLFRVERGHLVARNCGLRSRGAYEKGGGRLLEFVSRGTEPLKGRSDGIGTWPFAAFSDRPTCLITESVLISSGDVLSAELGRGLVVVSQCAIAAGGTVFSLAPDLVARRSLDADLWLEHCTVASEGNFVALGGWRGSEPGPDRPWVISTHKSVFFTSYQKPSREGVLLRADAEGLARGAGFWQANGDAFEVSSFALTGDGLPVAGRRADVTKQWKALWGSAHIRGVTGPHPPAGSPSTRPVVRLKPGNVEAGDLAIDPGYPPDAGPPRGIGVDLSRLGITPTARAGRRP